MALASTSKENILTKANILKFQKTATTVEKRKSYEKMIIQAISSLKDRNGVTIQAIKKYISSVFYISEENLKTYVIKYVRKCVEKGAIIKVNTFRYKLSPDFKQLKKKSKAKGTKKSKKDKEDKENIAPVATKSIPNKTKIKKTLPANKNGIEPKKSKSNKPKQVKESSSKEPKIKKAKKNDKKDGEPIKKKTKKEMNVVENEIEVIEKKKTIQSKKKIKLPKTNNATIAAGNKLKKQARKSLIKLNIKRSKIRKAGTQQLDQNE